MGTRLSRKMKLTRDDCTSIIFNALVKNGVNVLPIQGNVRCGYPPLLVMDTMSYLYVRPHYDRTGVTAGRPGFTAEQHKVIHGSFMEKQNVFLLKVERLATATKVETFSAKDMKLIGRTFGKMDLLLNTLKTYRLHKGEIHWNYQSEELRKRLQIRYVNLEKNQYRAIMRTLK